MDETTIDNNLKNQFHDKNSFNDWKPLNLGGLKPGAKDWITKDYQEEILDEKFKNSK